MRTSLGGLLPERLLFAEPLRQRMRVRFADDWIADSENVVLLHEPGRYPVAYFPKADIAVDWLEPSGHASEHRDLGPTKWYSVRARGRTAACGAWEHTELPSNAREFQDHLAFAWRAVDVFYEEDERILGHAADAYHRIDIPRSSRRLVVRHDDRVAADTHAPMVLLESGFAPRWYVPRIDIAGEALHAVKGQTPCPYKGLASYYDLGEVRNAAWSYRAPLDEVARVADLMSSYPRRVTITIDGEKLEEAPGQKVISHGPDRNLSVDEIGGIQLAEDAAATA
jgi:uncharacterized protein (DUF427 family)